MKIILGIILSVFFIQFCQAENIVFFQDSPDKHFYNESWLNVNSPSELGSSQNFSVDTLVKFKGLNSLQLKWKSAPGGNWVALVASRNWKPVSAVSAKYLRFSLYSEELFDLKELPALLMEDIENHKSEKIDLTSFIKEFPRGKWFDVVIPFASLKKAAGNLNFNQLKTIGFTQKEADNKEHKLNIDNIVFIENEDALAPNPPKNVSVQSEEFSASLKWEQSQEPFCLGYNVYFSNDGRNFLLKKQLLKTENQFQELLPVKNTLIYYKITAFNTDYKESGFSQIVSDTLYGVAIENFTKLINGQDNNTLNNGLMLKAKGYERHVSLHWDTFENASGYLLFASINGAEYIFRKQLKKTDTFYNDFVDSEGKGLKLSYKLIAYGKFNRLLSRSETAEVTTFPMSDEQLLTMVEEATFSYFWDFAHPVSGMARESNIHDPEICTTGGAGFGIMAIPVGIERGFITREQGLKRMLQIADFLEKAERFHGAWPHWFNGTTGKVIPFSTFDNGGDLVETSFLIEGLLAVRQYFNSSNNPEEQELYRKITHLWETVEWDWYRRDNENVIYWHWSPNFGWKMNFPLHGYMETLITYILAVASPTHPIPADLYHKGWAVGKYQNPRTFYGYEMEVGPDYGGPLFWEHYSFLGFDPRNKKDAYTNYFRNSAAITLINREHCIRNPNNFKGYSKDCWGLTASFNPFGYNAHAPDNDNGTITPSAALSSIVYTPEYSLDAIKHFYRVLGNKIWGQYGFTDAFNETQNWYSKEYLAIDQGPIIDMIENYRSGLLWKNFMANKEIQLALDNMGFTPDTANTPRFFPEKK